MHDDLCCMLEVPARGSTLFPAPYYGALREKIGAHVVPKQRLIYVGSRLFWVAYCTGVSSHDLADLIAFDSIVRGEGANIGPCFVSQDIIWMETTGEAFAAACGSVIRTIYGPSFLT